jgi:hypothetical protein
MTFNKRRWFAAAAAIGIVAIVLIGIRRTVRLSSDELRGRVVATIQSEAKASFLVTGSLDLTATTTIESTKTLLPGLINLSLGTNKAMVQVPGRAYYGFDVRELDARNIRFLGDTIAIDVPQPKLLSVDANLRELQVWTQRGWLRSDESVSNIERKAIMQIDNALARQAASHVATSEQPHLNTADALQKMLAPVLVAAGIENPVFRFTIGKRTFYE